MRVCSILHQHLQHLNIQNKDPKLESNINVAINGAECVVNGCGSRWPVQATARFPFWCSFSVFNKKFLLCPDFVFKSWFLLVLPKSLFMLILLRNFGILFRILCICLHFLYQFTYMKFLQIYHSSVMVQVTDKISLSKVILHIQQNDYA